LIFVLYNDIMSLIKHILTANYCRFIEYQE